MSVLSAAQAAIVGAPPNLPEGVEWPEIRYELHDLGDMPQDFRPGAYMGQSMITRTPAGQAPSLAGYCAVYRQNDLWFAYHETDGGSSRSIGYDDRERAVAEICSAVASSAVFWMEKIGWMLAGDQCVGRDRWGRHKQQVIRCDGRHYVIGREPSDRDYAENNRYGCFGFGGAQMAWRLTATGERVQSRNCWTQGDIPAEFRDLLPDNAVSVESDSTIAQRARMAVMAEEREARAIERKWLDDALRAWRGPAAELAAHEVLVAREAAYAEQDRRRSVEYEAQELERQWREDAYRAFRGSWVDLIGYEQECWLLEQEYAEEMWSSAYDY